MSHVFILFYNIQNLQTTQKQEAAKHCNCTIADVENALAKFTWAKEAQKKLEKVSNLREESSSFFWREINDGTLRFDRTDYEVYISFCSLHGRN